MSLNTLIIPTRRLVKPTDWTLYTASAGDPGRERSRSRDAGRVAGRPHRRADPTQLTAPPPKPVPAAPAMSSQLALSAYALNGGGARNADQLAEEDKFQETYKQNNRLQALNKRLHRSLTL